MTPLEILRLVATEFKDVTDEEVEKWVELSTRFTVPTANFIKEVEEYANGFDADEHAEMWIESRGKGGCPSSIRELINDADAIQEMLDELAEALRKGVKK